MKTISEAIVTRINYYLNKNNLTQYKLAQLSNIPFPTIKSIMQKRTKDITFKTIVMLSNAFDVTISEFLNEESFSYDKLIID